MQRPPTKGRNLKNAIAFAPATFAPSIIFALLAACGPSSNSGEGETVASASFAITGADFSGNSIRICGSRPPADPKYFCNSELSSPDAGETACPCFNFAADGSLVDPATGLPAALTDLCASQDLGPDDGPNTRPVSNGWTFTYAIFDSPRCAGGQLNDGSHDFFCADPQDLTEPPFNTSFEVLNPGPNTSHVVCETVNASNTFEFTSCAVSCVGPADGTPPEGCLYQIQFECGCTPSDDAGTCSCPGGLTAGDLSGSTHCHFDPTSCDILCPGL